MIKIKKSYTYNDKTKTFAPKYSIKQSFKIQEDSKERR